MTNKVVIGAETIPICHAKDSRLISVVSKEYHLLLDAEVCSTEHVKLSVIVRDARLLQPLMAKPLSV